MDELDHEPLEYRTPPARGSAAGVPRPPRRRPLRQNPGAVDPVVKLSDNHGIAIITG